MVNFLFVDEKIFSKRIVKTLYDRLAEQAVCFRLGNVYKEQNPMQNGGVWTGNQP
jgi:hypothetical protein